MIIERKELRRKRFSATIVVIVLMFLIRVDLAKAAKTGSGPFISVAPHTFDISVERGEKVKEKIKVFNRGNFAIPFKIRVIDFNAIDGTGEMEAVDLVESSDSAVRWFEFENESFIVDPAEKKNVEFTIDVPRDAKEQGFYASVILEADISTYLYNESKLQVIPHVGVLFMIKVGQADLSRDLEILEYTVVAEDRLERAEKIVNFITSPFDSESKLVDVTDTESPEFLVRLKNNSPYHHKLDGNIKISGVGWNKDDKLNFSELTILPGKTRDIIVKGAASEKNTSADGSARSDEGDGFGVLQAELNLETSEGIEKNEQRWVMVYSWKMWAMVFLFGAGSFLVINFAMRSIRCLGKSKEKNKKKRKDSKQKIG